MGAFIIFLLILLAVYFDARTLRSENDALYRKHVNHSSVFWTIMTFFFFLLTSPIYLLRRARFLQALRASFVSGEPVYKTPNFSVITEFVGVVLAWCLLSDSLLIIGQALKGRVPFLQDRLMAIVISGLLSDIVMVMLMYRAIRKNHQGGFWANVNFKRIDGLLLKGILFPVIVGASFAGLAFIVSESKVMTSSPLQNMLSKSSVSSLMLFAAMAMITGPLFEEIFFRGYLFSFAQKIRGRLFAIGFVACVFATLHLDQLWGDWMRFVIIFLMGLCITFFRARSGSIVPGIAAHYSYNISLLLIPVIYLCIANPAYCEYAVKGPELDKASQERLLKESIEKKPDFVNAYNELAWFYAENNRNLDEALRLVEVALKAKPGKSSYLDTKAEILFKLGRVEEAIEIEEALVRKNPSVKFYKQQLRKFMEAMDEFDSLGSRD